MLWKDPPSPLKKAGTGVKVSLLKGDLGRPPRILLLGARSVYVVTLNKGGAGGILAVYFSQVKPAINDLKSFSRIR